MVKNFHQCVISRMDVEKFIFESLFYGYQRECREPIFGSESYMALRFAIESARCVNRLE